MTFDWGSVLLLWLVIGIPGCAVGGIMAIEDEHPILCAVLLVVALVLLSVGVGLPEEVLGI